MTLDDCEAIFEKALKCKTEADFCYIIEPLLNEYEVLSIEIGRGSIYWRARIIEIGPFANLSDMDYPPPHIAKIGRLNDSGAPCFYVAAHKETAISEIKAKEGQLVQLAGFRVIDDRPLRLAMIGEYSNVYKCGYLHFGGSDPDRTITKLLNSMPLKDALKKIYIDKFFASVLSNPSAHEEDYLMSRALAQSVYAKSEADGIVFPSVKDRGGFNLGIKPEQSDYCFHNVCCLIARIGKVRNYGLYDFEIIQSAKMLDADNNFVWDESLAIDRFGLYGMNKEEYELAIKNQGDKNGLLNVLHRNSS